jgi:mono/diheme cytochrome c family protein
VIKTPFLVVFAVGVLFAGSDIPEKAAVRQNPLQTDPQAAAAGKKLFRQHCAECHGEAGEGGRRGPNLQDFLARGATPGQIFWILSNGVVRRGMPSWSKLPEAQRWQITAFLAGLSPNRR